MTYTEDQYAPSQFFAEQVAADGNITNELDQKRIMAYKLYEGYYNNNPDVLAITLRGSNGRPIFIPSAAKIIEATHRFMGKGFNYYVEPMADTAMQDQLDVWMADWFKREKVQAKYTENQRWGLIRGDWVFMLYGNPNKEIGKRISLATVHPSQVFEIKDEDEKVIIGYHIISLVKDFREDDNSKKIVQRRTFLKELNEDGEPTGRITSELTHWTVGKWDDRIKDKSLDVERVSYPEKDEDAEYLPEPISQLPIYRWGNKKQSSSDWGISQLSGLETLISGINQSISDEDITLVMQGLGIYATTSGPPRDDQEEVVAWNLGPGQVIEIDPDQDFKRVTGVTTVAPMQDHMKFMDEKGLSESSGTPEIAIGRVEVQSAESGISLKLQMMPLLAQNAEKEETTVGEIDQMFFNLTTMWLPAYEPESFKAEAVADASVVTIFEDPMPQNRDTEIQETILLRTSNLILTAMAIDKLRGLGWNYPTTGPNGEELTDDDIVKMLNAEARAAATAADPYALDPPTGGSDTPPEDDTDTGEA